MTVLTLLFHRAAIFISPGHLDRTSGPRITGEHGVYLYLYLSMSLSLSMSMSMLSFRLGIRHLLVVTSQTDRQRPQTETFDLPSIPTEVLRAVSRTWDS